MNIYLIAVILGIIEGLTEFLPISSTGHLILVNQFLKMPNEHFEVMFDVVIQLGAILSVIIYFRKMLIPFGGHKSHDEQMRVVDLWKKIIIGVIPTLILGYLFGDIIENALFDPYVVAGALIVGGIILIVIERRHKTTRILDTAAVTYGLAIALGFIQSLAMVPGTSRSAATIIGAMLLGCSRVVAAEFSFFLAIPTMAAASGYQVLKNGLHLSLQEWMVLSVGFIVSFLVAWVVIAFLMNFIKNKDFQPFGFYRIVLGILVFAYFGYQVL